MDLISNLFYALRYNLIELVFLVTAYLFMRRGKRAWQWYVVGILLQGYSVFGMFLGMSREPEVWKTAANFSAVGGYVVIALVFLFLMRKEDKKILERQKTAPKKTAKK